MHRAGAFFRDHYDEEAEAKMELIAGLPSFPRAFFATLVQHVDFSLVQEEISKMKAKTYIKDEVCYGVLRFAEAQTHEPELQQRPSSRSTVWHRYHCVAPCRLSAKHPGSRRQAAPKGFAGACVGEADRQRNLPIWPRRKAAG